LFLCALQQYFIYVWVMPESNYPPRACACPLPPHRRAAERARALR
jgi:hypothetical protein